MESSRSLARTDWFERATASSETGRLAAAVDWTATSIGDPSTWPQGLRTAVELCFGTNFPVLVTWGPDLVMLYNDGYRQLLGADKHPGAMGSPTAAVWPEIWDEIEPLFRQVIETGEPTLTTDGYLLVNRSGFDEETYHTWSYSPLRDDDGTIRGVLDVTTETTTVVVTRRRLRCLADLGNRLQAAGDDLDAIGAAVAALVTQDGETDVVAVAVDRLGPDGHRTPLVAAGREDLDPDRRLVVPLRAASEPGRVGILEIELDARRPLDGDAREFVSLLATAVGAALGGAQRRRLEVERLRTVSEELQRSMLPALVETPALAARYLPATDHLTIGGDWYDAVELGRGRVALLVGDCVGHGLAAAATMGNLRSASRALLLEEHGPAATIEALDRFARTVPGSTCTTVLCAIVDSVTGMVTWSTAGHPPALLLGPEGPVFLDGPVDVPLGVDPDRKRRQGERTLDGATAVVLFTDGLVERREEPIDVGFARLAAVAAGVGDSGDAQALADGILAELPAQRGDDAALLVHVPGRT